MIPDQQGTALAQPPQISNNVIGSISEQSSKIIGVSVGAIATTLVLAACGIWLWRRASIASTSSKCLLYQSADNLVILFL